MLTFNTILRCEGIDPRSVRLVRHQDTSVPERSPYALWRANDGRFERYQSLQREAVNFGVGHLLAAFVATPSNDTLFVGLYAVNAVTEAPPGSICPIRQTALEGHVLFDIWPDNRLFRYIGLLLIEWGSGYRSWVQRAERQEKLVVEIRREVFDPAFPGFRDFRYHIADIEAIPFGWREALRAVNGIYLLVCLETGKQYVGSAYGQDGLWGRFLDYARTGHGGNLELRRRGPANYQVCVLEVIPPTASQEDVVRSESMWKDKLRTRQPYGLNEN
jgi:hypothetical protein